MATCQQQDRATIGRLTEIAYMMAKTALPFTVFQHTAALEKRHGVALGVTYLNEKGCVELTTCVGESLEDELKAPATAEEWQEVARQFEDKWQYPNCIGAIGGKHIAIRTPANSGSMFHNYKMFYSIVLMAVVDAAYRFIIVDVGANGRSCDAGVLGNSAMATALENGTPDGL